MSRFERVRSAFQDGPLYLGNGPTQGTPAEPSAQFGDPSDLKRGFKQLRYRHPHAVGVVTIFVSQLVLQFVLYFALDLIQIFTTDVCVIDNAGTVQTTPSFCDVQMIGHAGSYPNYKNNLAISSLAVAGLIATWTWILGPWTRSTLTFEDDLGRYVMSFFVRDEPTDMFGTIASIVAGFGAAFLSGWLTLAMFGSTRYSATNANGFYEQTGYNLGGPAVSLSAHGFTYMTVIAVWITCFFVRRFMSVWARYVTQYTINDDAKATGQHHAMSLLVAVAKAMGFFMGTLAITAIQGVWFGPSAGYMTRDVARMALSTAIKGDALAPSFNVWMTFLVWPMAPAAAAVAFGLLFLWLIDLSGKGSDQLHIR